MECKKERIFENICGGSVYVKTKKILSIKVPADEHVYDSKVLPEFIENLQNQIAWMQQ